MDPLLVWPRTRLGYLYRSTIGQCDSVQIVRFSTLEQVLVSNIRDIAFQYLTRRLCSSACYFSYQRRCTKLYGSDISSINFPKVYPGNVEFRVASVTSVPQDWSDKFDFVHQRFLIVGLPRSVWYSVMSELFHVLKPGGHIELIDLDWLATVNAGPHATRFLGLISEPFCQTWLVVRLRLASSRVRGA